MLGLYKDTFPPSKQGKRVPAVKLVISNLGLLALATFGLVFFSAYKYLSSFSHASFGPAPSPGSSFAHLRSHCAHVQPIGRDEFLARQTALAETLHALNASAYVAEPGASAQFFGNLSGSHWHLSERPLLLIVSPEVQTDARGLTVKVNPRVAVLTPAFEETRAKMLPIAAEGVEWVSWPEDADPYQLALSAIPALKEEKGDIIVDGSIRNFIADGLRNAGHGANVRSAPVEVKHLRERKSPSEIEIMKCANEVTVLAIRAVRKHMYIGIRESQARQLLRNALGGGAGLSDLDGLVLFGENAALPHGSGTDRALGKDDFVLFDCGGDLHGYHSDVTRTFALPDSQIPKEHTAIWNLVHASQTAASHVAYNGTVTRRVDEVARKVIVDAGYGKYFTHRLGHGIGLEVHEDPYLRGGSSDIIATGHSFSNEPGVYIEGKVGVRLEDCFYIAEDGSPVFLTAGVGGQAKSPWEP